MASSESIIWHTRLRTSTKGRPERISTPTTRSYATRGHTAHTTARDVYEASEASDDPDRISYRTDNPSKESDYHDIDRLLRNWVDPTLRS